MVYTHTHKGRKKGDKVSSTTGLSTLATGETLHKHSALVVVNTGRRYTTDYRDPATMQNSVDHM